MIVKRKYVNRRFTTIDTALLENDKISLKAKGLIAYLLSRPEDWQVHMSQLQQICNDGETSIRTAMDELIKTGYVVRTRRRTEDGRLNGFEYEVMDIVEFDKEAEKNAIETNKTITRFSTNGETINGSSTNGETINGFTTNGETINGSSANGKSRPTYKDSTNNDSKNNDSKNSVCVENFEIVEEQLHTHTSILEDSLGNTHDAPNAEKKTAKSTQQKVAQKSNTQGVSFEQCQYATIGSFIELLKQIGFEQADSAHYFKKISNYCKSRGITSQDWMAYISLWLIDDQAIGKLKTESRSTHTAQAQTTQSEISKKLQDLEDYALSQKPKSNEWFELVLESLRKLWKNPEVSEQEKKRIEGLSQLITELQKK